MSSTLSFFLPAAIMVLLYTRLYIYARRHVRSIRSQLKQTTGLLVMQFATPTMRRATAENLGTPELINSCPSRTASPIPSNTAPGDFRSHTTASHIPKTVEKSTKTTGRPLTPEKMVEKSTKINRNESARSAKSAKSEIVNGGKKVKRNQSLRDKADVSDQKARITLGVIMGTFLFCWLPFFVVNILKSFAPDLVPLWLFQAVTWLGYANSTANPIIYSIFNRDFRRAFKKILLSLCRCCRRSPKSGEESTRYNCASHDDHW